MPRLMNPAPTPTAFTLTLGAATGTSCRDFYALGYCPEQDEAEKSIDPDHTSFTHIVRYKDFQRADIERVPTRLEDLWMSPAGKIYTAGFPKGVLEVTAKGATETAIKGVAGCFEALWGPSEDHLFACGSNAPFLLYRRFGTWQQVPLPKNVEPLRHVGGFSEREVYLVGDHGQVYHFDGMKVMPLEKVTTRFLVSIARLNDQQLCIGGYQGTLLWGSKTGFRLVPTGTEDPLLSLAPFEGQVLYGTSDGVYAFDGKKKPYLLIDQPARWVDSLGDGVLVVHEDLAWVYSQGKLTRLDTIL